MGMDLGLDIGNRYNIALVVFFIPYFLFEVSCCQAASCLVLTDLQLPSNILLRKVGSANWLAGIAFAWGTVMLGQVRCAYSSITRASR